MAALYHVVQNLRSSNSTARLQHASLKLGALISYQINSLIYRPAEGRAESILLQASCQHVPASADGLTSRPIMYGRGTYFLSDIVNNTGAYQLPDNRPIEVDTILALYQRDFMEDIKVEFSQSHAQSSWFRNPKSSELSRKRKTTHRLHGSDDESCSEMNGGVEENVKEQDTRRSACWAAFDAPPRTPTAAPASIISNELSAIQRQFASDIFQLAPSPKLAPNSPWVLLDPAQRIHAKVDIFYSLDLHSVFSQVQYRFVSDHNWNNVVFRRYFPAKGTSMSKALQQFPSASYYRRWRALMDWLDEDDAKIIQNHHLTQWFDNLYWVPHPDSDRMWSTKKGSSRKWTILPPGERRHCHRIAINPKLNGKDGMDVLVAGTP